MNARFNIFKNDRKTKETSPDYTGSVDVGDEVKHDLAIWVKTDKNGRKYYSGNIRPHQERDPVNAPRQEQRAPVVEDDSMPF